MRYLRAIAVVFFALLLISCSAVFSQTSDSTTETATIEVIYFDEPVQEYIVYKAVVRAPVGTRFESPYGSKPIVRNQEETFLLAHRLYQKQPNPRAGSPEGSLNDSVVDTYFYLFHGGSTISRYVVVPGTGRRPDQPIETYIDIVKPGIYEIAEGDTFTFAQVGDATYEVTITEMP